MSESPAGKGDTPRPVDRNKWNAAWARRCKAGCRGPWISRICIYCGKVKSDDDSMERK